MNEEKERIEREIEKYKESKEKKAIDSIIKRRESEVDLYLKLFSLETGEYLGIEYDRENIMNPFASVLENPKTVFKQMPYMFTAEQPSYDHIQHAAIANEQLLNKVLGLEEGTYIERELFGTVPNLFDIAPEDKVLPMNAEWIIEKMPIIDVSEDGLYGEVSTKGKVSPVLSSELKQRIYDGETTREKEVKRAYEFWEKKKKEKYYGDDKYRAYQVGVNLRGKTIDWDNIGTDTISHEFGAAREYFGTRLEEFSYALSDMDRNFRKENKGLPALSSEFYKHVVDVTDPESKNYIASHGLDEEILGYVRDGAQPSLEEKRRIIADLREFKRDNPPHVYEEELQNRLNRIAKRNMPEELFSLHSLIPWFRNENRDYLSGRVDEAEDEKNFETEERIYKNANIESKIRDENEEHGNRLAESLKRIEEEGDPSKEPKRPTDQLRQSIAFAIENGDSEKISEVFNKKELLTPEDIQREIAYITEELKKPHVTREEARKMNKDLHDFKEQLKKRLASNSMVFGPLNYKDTEETLRLQRRITSLENQLAEIDLNPATSDMLEKELAKLMAMDDIYRNIPDSVNLSKKQGEQFTEAIVDSLEEYKKMGEKRVRDAEQRLVDNEKAIRTLESQLVNREKVSSLGTDEHVLDTSTFKGIGRVEGLKTGESKIIDILKGVRDNAAEKLEEIKKIDSPYHKKYSSIIESKIGVIDSLLNSDIQQLNSTNRRVSIDDFEEEINDIAGRNIFSNIKDEKRVSISGIKDEEKRERARRTNLAIDKYEESLKVVEMVDSSLSIGRDIKAMINEDIKAEDSIKERRLNSERERLLGETETLIKIINEKGYDKDSMMETKYVDGNLAKVGITKDEYLKVIEADENMELFINELDSKIVSSESEEAKRNMASWVKAADEGYIVNSGDWDNVGYRVSMEAGLKKASLSRPTVKVSDLEFDNIEEYREEILEGISSGKITMKQPVGQNAFAIDVSIDKLVGVSNDSVVLYTDPTRAMSFDIREMTSDEEFFAKRSISEALNGEEITNNFISVETKEKLYEMAEEERRLARIINGYGKEESPKVSLLASRQMNNLEIIRLDATNDELSENNRELENRLLNEDSVASVATRKKIEENKELIALNEEMKVTLKNDIDRIEKEMELELRKIVSIATADEDVFKGIIDVNPFGFSQEEKEEVIERRLEYNAAKIKIGNFEKKAMSVFEEEKKAKEIERIEREKKALNAIGVSYDETSEEKYRKIFLDRESFVETFLTPRPDSLGGSNKANAYTDFFIDLMNSQLTHTSPEKDWGAAATGMIEYFQEQVEAGRTYNLTTWNFAHNILPSMFPLDPEDPSKAHLSSVEMPAEFDESGKMTNWRNQLFSQLRGEHAESFRARVVAFDNMTVIERLQNVMFHDLKVAALKELYNSKRELGESVLEGNAHTIKVISDELKVMLSTENISGEMIKGFLRKDSHLVEALKGTFGEEIISSTVDEINEVLESQIRNELEQKVAKEDFPEDVEKMPSMDDYETSTRGGIEEVTRASDISSSYNRARYYEDVLDRLNRSSESTTNKMLDKIEEMVVGVETEDGIFSYNLDGVEEEIREIKKLIPSLGAEEAERIKVELESFEDAREQLRPAVRRLEKTVGFISAGDRMTDELMKRAIEGKLFEGTLDDIAFDSNNLGEMIKRSPLIESIRKKDKVFDRSLIIIQEEVARLEDLSLSIGGVESPDEDMIKIVMQQKSVVLRGMDFITDTIVAPRGVVVSPSRYLEKESLIRMTLMTDEGMDRLPVINAMEEIQRNLDTHTLSDLIKIYEEKGDTLRGKIKVDDVEDLVPVEYRLTKEGKIEAYSDILKQGYIVNDTGIPDSYTVATEISPAYRRKNKIHLVDTQYSKPVVPMRSSFATEGLVTGEGVATKATNLGGSVRAVVEAIQKKGTVVNYDLETTSTGSKTLGDAEHIIDIYAEKIQYKEDGRVKVDNDGNPYIERKVQVEMDGETVLKNIKTYQRVQSMVSIQSPAKKIIEDYKTGVKSFTVDVGNDTWHIADLADQLGWKKEMTKAEEEAYRKKMDLFISDIGQKQGVKVGKTVTADIKQKLEEFRLLNNIAKYSIPSEARGSQGMGVTEKSLSHVESLPAFQRFSEYTSVPTMSNIIESLRSDMEAGNVAFNDVLFTKDDEGRVHRLYKGERKYSVSEMTRLAPYQEAYSKSLIEAAERAAEILDSPMEVKEYFGDHVTLHKKPIGAVMELYDFMSTDNVVAVMGSNVEVADNKMTVKAIEKELGDNDYKEVVHNREAYHEARMTLSNTRNDLIFDFADEIGVSSGLEFVVNPRGGDSLDEKINSMNAGKATKMLQKKTVIPVRNASQALEFAKIAMPNMDLSNVDVGMVKEYDKQIGDITETLFELGREKGRISPTTLATLQQHDLLQGGTIDVENREVSNITRVEDLKGVTRNLHVIDQMSYINAMFPQYKSASNATAMKGLGLEDVAAAHDAGFDASVVRKVNSMFAQEVMSFINNGHAPNKNIEAMLTNMNLEQGSADVIENGAYREGDFVHLSKEYETGAKKRIKDTSQGSVGVYKIKGIRETGMTLSRQILTDDGMVDDTSVKPVIMQGVSNADFVSMTGKHLRFLSDQDDEKVRSVFLEREADISREHAARALESTGSYYGKIQQAQAIQQQFSNNPLFSLGGYDRYSDMPVASRNQELINISNEKGYIDMPVGASIKGHQTLIHADIAINSRNAVLDPINNTLDFGNGYTMDYDVEVTEQGKMLQLDVGRQKIVQSSGWRIPESEKKFLPASHTLGNGIGIKANETKVSFGLKDLHDITPEGIINIEGRDIQLEPVDRVIRVDPANNFRAETMPLSTKQLIDTLNRPGAISEADQKFEVPSISKEQVGATADLQRFDGTSFGQNVRSLYDDITTLHNMGEIEDKGSILKAWNEKLIEAAEEYDRSPTKEVDVLDDIKNLASLENITFNSTGTPEQKEMKMLDPTFQPTETIENKTIDFSTPRSIINSLESLSKQISRSYDGNISGLDSPETFITNRVILPHMKEQGMIPETLDISKGILGLEEIAMNVHKHLNDPATEVKMSKRLNLEGVAQMFDEEQQQKFFDEFRAENGITQKIEAMPTEMKYTFDASKEILREMVDGGVYSPSMRVVAPLDLKNYEIDGISFANFSSPKTLSTISTERLGELADGLAGSLNPNDFVANKIIFKELGYRAMGKGAERSINPNKILESGDRGRIEAALQLNWVQRGVRQTPSGIRNVIEAAPITEHKLVFGGNAGAQIKNVDWASLQKTIYTGDGIASFHDTTRSVYRDQRETIERWFGGVDSKSYAEGYSISEDRPRYNSVANQAPTDAQIAAETLRLQNEALIERAASMPDRPQHVFTSPLDIEVPRYEQLNFDDMLGVDDQGMSYDIPEQRYIPSVTEVPLEEVVNQPVAETIVKESPIVKEEDIVGPIRERMSTAERYLSDTKMDIRDKIDALADNGGGKWVAGLGIAALAMAAFNNASSPLRLEERPSGHGVKGVNGTPEDGGMNRETASYQGNNSPQQSAYVNSGDKGYQVRVSGRATTPIDAEQVQGRVAGLGEANKVNVNIQDDRASMDTNWLEEQFTNFLNRG